MKILSAKQLKAADEYTILNEPIASIELMERASQEFVKALTALPEFLAADRVVVICGVGNNGGDGMAIARILLTYEIKVEVWTISLGAGATDFLVNQENWSLFGEIKAVESPEDLPALHPSDLVVDAIFGSGINRPITGLAARVVEQMNLSEATIVAVDIPSGLYVDQPNPDSSVVVQAHHTLTFQNPKLAFLLPQNHQYVGEWQVLDIGLSEKFLSELPDIHQTIDHVSLLPFQRLPQKYAHKGSYGHALLVTGSQGKIGAAVLSAKAALRSGLGLLTVHLPSMGSAVVQSTVPEAMVQQDPNLTMVSEIAVTSPYHCIGLGPGLGTNPITGNALKELFMTASCPLVIDADALNMISQHQELLDEIPENSIITPHPKEFERLVGPFSDDYQRLEMQEALASRYQLIVIYKGAHTTIALPDGALYFNTTGNPGMGTAGSGDVLTGMITGLLCRTQDCKAAALLGVYLHGLAGDLAAEEKGMISMTAGDLIDQIAPAFKKLGLPL